MQQLIGNLMGFQDDRLSRAERYCDDYCHGFHESLYLTSEVSSDESEGHKRGFAAGRARPTSRDEEEGHPLAAELRNLNGYSTAKEQVRWKFLNNEVIRRGNRGWEDSMLELFRYLRLYAGATNQSAEEVSAQRVVMRGIIERFAATLTAASRGA
jgi:hypothetical protein